MSNTAKTTPKIKITDQEKYFDALNNLSLAMELAAAAEEDRLREIEELFSSAPTNSG